MKAQISDRLRHFIDRWGLSFIIGVIMLMIGVSSGDRFTATDAQRAIATRDAERGAAIRIICEHYPDECKAEGLNDGNQ